MAEAWTWMLWLCLFGFVVFYGIRVLRDIRNLFSPPLVISFLMFGILVFRYFDYDRFTLAEFLNVDAYNMTMAYTVVCLLAFSFFYEKGILLAPRRQQAESPINQIPHGTISVYITLIAIIGFAAHLIFTSGSGGIVAFYSQPHGTGGDYNNTSAYLYALPNFLWPAMLICYVTWTSGGRRSLYLLVLLVLIIAALFTHTFLFGNRNGIIRFCIILGGAYTFIHRPSIMRSMPLLALLAFAIAAVLIVPHIRQYLYLGADRSLTEALSEYLSQQDQILVRREGGGHELFFNVAVVQSAFSTGTYDYGAQYVYPFINLFPRGLWPGKPYQTDFGVDYFALVENTLGWSAGLGSAIGGVAQTFLSFSWFGFVLWGIFGFYCGRAFGAARHAPTLMNLGWLISALLASIYWGAQSFSAVFSAWFFTIIPFYGLVFLAALHRSMQQGRIKLSRRRAVTAKTKT